MLCLHAGPGRRWNRTPHLYRDLHALHELPWQRYLPQSILLIWKFFLPVRTNDSLLLPLLGRRAGAGWMLLGRDLL